MTLGKQIHIKAITNNNTCCVSTYGKLLPHLSGTPTLSPITLLIILINKYRIIENNRHYWLIK